MKPEYETYLRKTLSMPHSGGSLWSHLLGTWKLLSDAGQPQYICNAGLFHSIYGTRHYRLQCASLDKRDEVQTLIGLQSENLVYLFCVIDRPHVLFLGKNVVMDHHRKKLVNIADWFNDLLIIERANLDEQDETKRKIRNNNQSSS